MPWLCLRMCCCLLPAPGSCWFLLPAAASRRDLSLPLTALCYHACLAKQLLAAPDPLETQVLLIPAVCKVRHVGFLGITTAALVTRITLLPLVPTLGDSRQQREALGGKFSPRPPPSAAQQPTGSKKKQQQQQQQARASVQ
jgi:hypothetical protein